eukprot:TRINITY_DN54060_c0_g1_i2.p1 TRINITY_DN54060_c0_g1~~TRINITY_DN54060_c0_g1_i2.p1  ORF type:complete len:109 (-),score=27.57 TRINITY_DN54060_c0_g1_i2:107-433(-)
MQRGLVGSEMCIRDRWYQRRVHGNITGRDCWGCGTSRAVISLLNFDFKQAYDFNKRIVVVFPLLVYLWFKWIFMNIKILLMKKNSTTCLLYTSPSPRDLSTSRMPSSA